MSRSMRTSHSSFFLGTVWIGVSFSWSNSSPFYIIHIYLWGSGKIDNKDGSTCVLNTMWNIIQCFTCVCDLDISVTALAVTLFEDFCFCWSLVFADLWWLTIPLTSLVFSVKCVLLLTSLFSRCPKYNSYYT